MSAHGRSPRSVLFLTVFMDLIGFGIVLPLLPIYARAWGASALMNGLLMAVYSLMQFLFAPAWGHLSDRVGRRPIILVSLSGSVVGYGLFGVAGLAQSVPLLFASRLLSGVMGANIAVAQAYIADTTAAEHRAHGMGLIGAAFGLGFILGPAFAGLLSPLGEAAPGFGAALICGINLVLAARGLPESLPPEHRHTGPRGESRLRLLLDALRTPGVRSLLWMFFVFTIALSVWESILPVFCSLRFGWEERTISFVFVYFGVLAALVQGYLVRRLRAFVSEVPLIWAGTVITALAFGLIAWTLRPWLHLLSLGLLSFGYGASNPSFLGLLSRRVGPREQGRVLGVSQSLSSLGRVVGPLAGYSLLGVAQMHPRGHWAEAMPFLFGTLLVGCVAMASFAVLRRPGKSQSEPV